MTEAKPNYYNTSAAFVAADAVTVEPARADLVRRQDVVHVVDRMIDGYMTQQRALLDQVTGETVGGGRNGFLSDADQVAERRQTSKMYLRHYSFVTALAVGGVVLLAWSNGMVADISALAAWICGTGVISLVLAWRRHGDEFAHSPEGIARHVIDAHWDVTSYEAETRRKSIEWEFDAERQRQAAAERQAEHARQQAALRIAEIDARRRTIEAQRAPVDTLPSASQRRFVVEWQPESPQTVQDAPHAALSASPAQIDHEDCCGGSTAVSGASWQADLLQWVAGLYAPGAMTDAGIIKGRTPWAARSAWLEADKAAAKRACVSMRPALIVEADGGRWRLRREMFTDAEQALQVLSPRL